LGRRRGLTAEERAMATTTVIDGAILGVMAETVFGQ
jgi:hypothetical protein